MIYKYRDIALAMICAFLGSVKGYFVSQIKSIDAIQIFGLRSVGALCFLLPLIVYGNCKIFYNIKCNITLLVRSIIGNIAVCGYYFGFVYLPIAEASVLFYSTPVFTIFIGRIFLKEHCGLPEISATVLSVLGVGILCFPKFSFNYRQETVIGVSGSLIGAFAQAVALVIIRKITHVPPIVTSLWWAAVGMIFSSVLTVTLGEFKPWNCGWEALCIVSIAVTGFVSEVCLVSALKSTEAVLISIVLTSEIVWALILQLLLDAVTPSVETLVGGALIIIALLLPSILSKCSKLPQLSLIKDNYLTDIENTKN